MIKMIPYLVQMHGAPSIVLSCMKHNDLFIPFTLTQALGPSQQPPDYRQAYSDRILTLTFMFSREARSPPATPSNENVMT